MLKMSKKEKHSYRTIRVTQIQDAGISTGGERPKTGRQKVHELTCIVKFWNIFAISSFLQKGHLPKASLNGI